MNSHTFHRRPPAFKSPFFLLVAFILFFPACADDFPTLLKKGAGAYENKNFTAAVDALVLAVDRWRERDGVEKKSQAYHLLGQSYDKLRKLDKAIEAYTNAVNASPQAGESAYELGMIYLTTQEVGLAEKAFKVALRTKKDDPMALVGLGNSLFQQKKYEEARTAYQRVIDTSPGVKTALESLEITRQKLQARSKPRPQAVPPKVKTAPKTASKTKQNQSIKIKKKSGR
ncbi:MAG: tetratricopeptide repeat protein [Elusimicrobia bacterium]|nr:tetratricopeptide repeat protein [Candidatus Obscuribacterium magneticum]